MLKPGVQGPSAALTRPKVVGQSGPGRARLQGTADGQESRGSRSESREEPARRFGPGFLSKTRPGAPAPPRAAAAATRPLPPAPGPGGGPVSAPLPVGSGPLATTTRVSKGIAGSGTGQPDSGSPPRGLASRACSPGACPPCAHSWNPGTAGVHTPSPPPASAREGTGLGVLALRAA